MNCYYCPNPIFGGVKLRNSDMIVGCCSEHYARLHARGEVCERLDRIRESRRSAEAQVVEAERTARELRAQEEEYLKELRALPLHERSAP